jgi:hypothetical protein
MTLPSHHPPTGVDPPPRTPVHDRLDLTVAVHAVHAVLDTVPAGQRADVAALTARVLAALPAAGTETDTRMRRRYAAAVSAMTPLRSATVGGH